MGMIQQVIFKLDEEEYGIEIMNVYVIEKYHEVIKIPNTPEYIKGIINLRGEVLPIYDLRKKFHLNAKPIDENTKVIVTYSNDMKVGFVVDSVTEIQMIDEKDIETPPKIVVGINRKYIKKIAKLENRMIVLIDIDKILSDEEQEVLSQVVSEGN